MADSWIVTRAYGRCIEALQRLDVAMRAQIPRAVIRGDDAELKALGQERNDWVRLMRETPKWEGRGNE